MGNPIKLQPVSRRTVLIAAAGAAPLLALMSGSAEAKMAQTAVRYQDFTQGRQAVRRLQAVRHAKRVQVCRRRHLAERVVRFVGQDVTRSHRFKDCPRRQLEEAKPSANSTAAPRIEG